jgi:hypothetical protein
MRRVHLRLGAGLAANTGVGSLETFRGFRDPTERSAMAGYQYSRSPSLGMRWRMSPESFGMTVVVAVVVMA